MAAAMAGPLGAASGSRVDAAFAEFWAADSPQQAARAAELVVKSGVHFDDALRRLKAGRAYTAQKTGVLHFSNRTSDGVEHNYAVDIPADYDPAKRYQVRFQLHGGIGARSDNRPRGNGEIGALAGAEQIYVLPYAWESAPWWGEDQVLNLNAILDSLKGSYNVDENRVVLSGVSDGGTGTYYMAMRDTTPFASFLPLNGFLMVLASEDIDDGRMFPNNLRNKPFFVVNGGQDRLYPISLVEPFTKHLMNGGVKIDYHPRPAGEHNTRWWPDVKDAFEKFVSDHPRDPDPDTLTWEAAGNRDNRAHWLILDEFRPIEPGKAADLPDLNLVDTATEDILDGSQDVLFRRGSAAGRVDLARSGNTVRATARGVSAFTLLLSPDKFDFRQPLVVTANGREVFRGRVARSVATLMKWAARDNDRTMLYAAEIQIRLPR